MDLAGDDFRNPQQINRRLAIDRKLLAIAGCAYLLWWFAVEFTLPNAFNPLISRVAVVLYIFAVLLFSYKSSWLRQHLNIFVQSCLWLITFHYYYLFYCNSGDINWVIGSYITVIAINFCLLSNKSLLSYSLFVILLSVALTAYLPPLKISVFLPGMLTIVIQANIGLRSRLKVIKTLGDSNERFQLLFNSTFEGVLVHENRHIIDINEALLKMLGFSREELIGKDALDIVIPKDRDLISKKIYLNDENPYETAGIKKNGSILEIEIRGKSFKYEHDRFARLVTVQDLSDRKRAEKERITSLAMAESIQARDEFISIASHELKTPLCSLKLQAQIVELDLKRNSSKVYTPTELNKLIAVFYQQTNRLIELVETMLDVSRISKSQLVLDRKSIDLATVVRNSIESLQNENKTASISVDLPEHMLIWADPILIQKVIEKLLSNAIKYGNGNPIYISLRSQGSQVVLKVKDEGLGIDHEKLKRIFGRFERAISAQNISGFGLGLYIARQIVEAHGGNIAVESQLGQGSSFTVNLPQLAP